MAGEGFVFGEASVESAIAALKRGEIVLLAEDDDESSGGSLVVSPEHATVEQLEFLAEQADRITVALEPTRYRTVCASLDAVVLDNDNLAKPALSVSAKGADVSAHDAAGVAATLCSLLQVDADAALEDSQLVCPGAVSLTKARDGGVLRRAGATEASIELNKPAGVQPIGLYATLRDGGLDSLKTLATRWNVTLSSTADLVAFSRRRERLVERTAPPTRMPTKHGLFIAHSYRSRIDGTEHIALVKAVGKEGELHDELADFDPFGIADGVANGAGSEAGYPLQPFKAAEGRRPPLVRVHSECCTGDVFSSLRCDCGPQLEKALQQINADGWGVLLYLRGQEGRGIGLGAKLHAYALQERGLDTLDANTELGLPVDSREYGTGAQILVDLGISDMRLMSNNPKKFTGLAGYGLHIVERVPSHTAPNPENINYLRTKLSRMGHLLELGE